MKTEVFNNVRFVHKGDTEQNWNLATGFIPLDKELIIYKADENTPFPRMKIGDGITPVQNLPWVNNSVFGKESGKTKEVFKEIWSRGIVADFYDQYS